MCVCKCNDVSYSTIDFLCFLPTDFSRRTFFSLLIFFQFLDILMFFVLFFSIIILKNPAFNVKIHKVVSFIHLFSSLKNIPTILKRTKRETTSQKKPKKVRNIILNLFFVLAAFFPYFCVLRRLKICKLRFYSRKMYRFVFSSRCCFLLFGNNFFVFILCFGLNAFSNSRCERIRTIHMQLAVDENETRR